MRTSKQEGGAIGSELAPEGREKVHELEDMDATRSSQGMVEDGRHIEQDGHHEKAE